MAVQQLGARASRPLDAISLDDLVLLLAPILPTSPPAQGGLWLNNGVATIALPGAPGTTSPSSIDPAYFPFGLLGLAPTSSAGGSAAAAVANYGTALAVGNQITVGGLLGTAQVSHVPVKPYSLNVEGTYGPITATSANGLRFEVRGTDNDEDFDVAGKNRSELVFGGTTIAPYSTFVADFQVMMESNGTLTDRAFLSLMQVHGDDALGYAAPFLLGVVTVNGQEVVNVGANSYSASAANHQTSRQFLTTQPFVRGAYHTVHVEFVPDMGEGAGRILVVWDGVTIVNQTGIATNFPNATAYPYAKIGIYAAQPTQAADTGLVAHHRAATFAIQSPGQPAAQPGAQAAPPGILHPTYAAFGLLGAATN